MPANDKDRPIDTVRLSPRDKAKLLDALKARDAAVPLRNNRRRLRVDYNVAGATIRISHPNGGSVQYTIVPRNLSVHGMAFIHGQYVHQGYVAELVLPTVGGDLMKAEGVTSGSRHVAGIIHEVSVVFNKPLDLTNFVALTPEQQKQCEDENASVSGRNGTSASNDFDAGVKVSGTALIVDDSKMDRQLMGMWLKRMGMTVVEAQSAAEAVAAVKSGKPDLIVMDLMIGDDSGNDVTAQLRASGYKGPIMACSAEEGEEAQSAALEAGCNAFLVKPVVPQDLRATVESLLTIDIAASTAGPVRSTMSGDTQMQPLIVEFVESLAETVAQLIAAQEEQDWAAIRKVCRMLKGAGAGYGFAPITQQARMALGPLGSEPVDVETVSKSVAELVSVLRSATSDR